MNEPANPRPSAADTTTSTASASGSGPSVVRWSWREPPVMFSITRNGAFAEVYPERYMVTM